MTLKHTGQESKKIERVEKWTNATQIMQQSYNGIPCTTFAK